MLHSIARINDTNINIYSLNTVIVGSGAAGLNAADRLYSLGQRDIAIVTEGLYMGTSRNTGSDKQTYYKLTLAGDKPDSVYDMARTLFNGGSMHGDIALIEASLSAQCFYRLVDIGVPFPHNSYGEYVGYKTDHDPRQRATSAGPLTSHYMTNRLQDQVMAKNIKIFDGYQVIGILTDQDKTRTLGLLTLNLNALEDPDNRYVVFNCTNIVYATGGPAGMYGSTVYPTSQTGATGIALEAGVVGRNLTESQYGIASIKFRWNLSGTYQQVLPRYVSTDRDGNDEREFLWDYFKVPGKLLDAIFLKGYQWPFDPRKIENYGSSLIDLLVYHETVIRGRRVFLDYTKNPAGASNDGNLDFTLLGDEAYEYLKRSGALFGTPIQRLAHMNQPAIDLYMDNGIDLSTEYLEIAVCAQHNNGGLGGNIWWESNLRHFFPIGEVNGSHGVYRPGGSALNSGQVGGLRAAQFIAARYGEDPMNVTDFLNSTGRDIGKKIEMGKKFMANVRDRSNVQDIREEMGKRMDLWGAHIRSSEGARQGVREAKKALLSLTENTTISSARDLPQAYKNYDLLMAQYVYLSAILDYIERGGGSRGSYLICHDEGEQAADGLPGEFRFTLDKGRMNGVIQEVTLRDGVPSFEWKKVRPIPEGENWFESVWNDYRRGAIFDA
ncbi:MAG TPA: FAD-binding protein [Clostridiales bacterium]|nr:FAD-binding protein [Clostridiales bacterium]